MRDRRSPQLKTALPDGRVHYVHVILHHLPDVLPSRKNLISSSTMRNAGPHRALYLPLHGTNAQVSLQQDARPHLFLLT